ncbi:MAG TPA: HAMP domain-containing sensor histidine kinase [Candidatus Polarisedimenticolia bacterium]|nr:HAMP domain-containing sensor histidine kinase [Candidatus Polarisedimenticolia bacterium]
MAAAGRSGRLRGGSLRAWLRLASACLVLLALMLSVLLFAVTSWMEGSVVSMAVALEGDRIAGELQAELLNEIRLADIVAVLGSDSHAALLEESRLRIGRLLTEARRHAGTVPEAELLGLIERQAAAYLRERDELESRGADLSAVLSAVAPELESILGRVEEFQTLNAEQATRAPRQAARLNRAANAASVVSFGLMALSLLAVVSLAVRHVERPLRSMVLSIGNLKSGADEERIAERGPLEVRQLARAFNELSAALRKEKQNHFTVLAGVVHDLKNPLAGLQMLLASLPREPEGARGEAARRVLSLVDGQIRQMQSMTSDLLETARVEAGRFELKRSEVDLRSLLSDAAAVASATTTRHRIEPSFPQGPVVVHGDARRISQVVGNLLHNAIKYSPRGGPVRLELRTEGRSAVVTVADAGVGIKQEELPFLFTPFWRSSAVGADIAGTGLGLSVARRIVLAHGGTIEAESREGEGSAFRIVLPLAAAGGPRPG